MESRDPRISRPLRYIVTLSTLFPTMVRGYQDKRCCAVQRNHRRSSRNKVTHNTQTKFCFGSKACVDLVLSTNELKHQTGQLIHAVHIKYPEPCIEVDEPWNPIISRTRLISLPLTFFPHPGHQEQDFREIVHAVIEMKL